MKLGVVLGAGGTVGIAYHTGVLRALHEVAGIDPADADLVVGTSAGAVVAAYLRTGWTTDDLWQFALGTHPLLEGLSADELASRRNDILAPLPGGPVDVARRLIGSAYVTARALTRLRGPSAPRLLGRLFPAGLFAMEEGRRRFAAELPKAWPTTPLWVCAVDLATGRRVVLGRPGRAPLVSLSDAVLASCAIPGLYPPVRVGSMTLIDGGVHSTTNLDLAAKEGCDLIIGVAPMAFDTADPRPRRRVQFGRAVPARMLVGEMAGARRRGAEVLVIRPSASELRIHGMNLMRRDGGDLVARAAFEATARTLETDRFRRALTLAA